MTLNETLINRLEASRAQMLAHLDEIDRNRKIYPLWTVREIIAHISGWDDATIGYIRAVVAGETPHTPAARGMDVYNAETVSTREGLDYDRIYREYITTRSVLLDLIRAMPEENITETFILPWGEAGSLVNMIDIFGPHEEVHAKDVGDIIAEANK